MDDDGKRECPCFVCHPKASPHRFFTPLFRIGPNQILDCQRSVSNMKNPISYIYLFSIAIAAATSSAESPDDKDCINEKNYGDCPSNSLRVISRRELESKKGENGSAIWLSVLGEVYDVTAGKSYYGKGKSYGAFAGTDCTVCYVSGIFTADEAAKHTDEISDDMLPGVLDWVSFYGTHDSYKFVGYLVDPRFYDEKGEPTDNLIGLRKRISSLKK